MSDGIFIFLKMIAYHLTVTVCLRNEFFNKPRDYLQQHLIEQEIKCTTRRCVNDFTKTLSIPEIDVKERFFDLPFYSVKFSLSSNECLPETVCEELVKRIYAANMQCALLEYKAQNYSSYIKLYP